MRFGRGRFPVTYPKAKTPVFREFRERWESKDGLRNRRITTKNWSTHIYGAKEAAQPRLLGSGAVVIEMAGGSERGFAASLRSVE